MKTLLIIVGIFVIVGNILGFMFIYNCKDHSESTEKAIRQTEFKRTKPVVIIILLIIVCSLISNQLG